MAGNKEIAKALARCELFKTLLPEAVEKLAAACSLVQAREGDVIVAENSPSDAIYVVVKGSVDYIKRMDEKRGLVLARWRESDVFGLTSVVDGKGHFVSAVAATPGEYVRIPAAELWKVCEADPHFEHRVFTQVLLTQSGRLRQLTVRLREFLSKILE
jgi:CRP-like cAMP-binding protein